MMEETPYAVIVMGVSGCGKSTIGKQLASLIDGEFIEGDSLHPAGNIEKMSSGHPLTDEDRHPWLDQISVHVHEVLQNRSSAVASCSSLRRTYRDQLRRCIGDRLVFVFLDGSPEVLRTRTTRRSEHFMPTSLLDSQLSTLEKPLDEPDIITVSIETDVDTIVRVAIEGIRNFALATRAA